MKEKEKIKIIIDILYSSITFLDRDETQRRISDYKKKQQEQLIQ